MLRRVLPCLLPAVLLATLPTFPLLAQDSLRVDGLVQDTEGRPLAGVRAALVAVPPPEEATRLVFEGRRPEPVEETTSDASGYFLLRAPEVGFFRVRLEKKGHGAKTYDLRPLLSDIALPPVALTPVSPRDVVLRSAEGRPLEGRVALRPAEKTVDSRWAWMRSGWRPDRPIVQTDQDGRAEVSLEAEVADWWVEASALDHASERRRWSPGKPLRMVLEPGFERHIQVLDAAGEAVAAATLAIEGHRLPSSATDEHGMATLRSAGRGAVEIDLLAPSGDSARQRLDPLEENDSGEEHELTVISLPSRTYIAGQVREAEIGTAVAGALVWEPRATDSNFARTDAAGYYVLPTDDRRGDLMVMANGYREAGARYSLEPAAEGVVADRGAPAKGPSIELAPAAFVAGRVVDPEGNPVPRADILVQPMWRGSTRGERILMTRSNDQGVFRWASALTDTKVILSAKAEGFAAKEHDLEPLEPRERREGIVLSLVRGALGVGWVLDERDAPIAGAEIRLQEPGHDSRFRGFLPGQQDDVYRSNAEGRFEVPALLAGRYDLDARASGHAPLLVRGIEVPEGSGQIDLGTLVLAPGAELTGRVRDPDGQAIEGAVVMVGKPDELRSRLFQRNFGYDKSDAHTGRDGRFVIEDRAAGEKIEVAVSKEGYVGERIGAVTVPNEQPVEVVLQPASKILGRVVDSDHRPVAEAQLSALPEGQRGGGFRAQLGAARATSRDDGTFEIPGVEPGLVTVSVQAADFAPLNLSGLEVPAEVPLRDLELVLEAGASLVGTVMDADGEPASQAFVMLSGRGGGGPGREFSQTDADGNYRLDGLSLGAKMATASLNNGATTTKAVTIEPGDNRLDLRLAAGVEIRGQVMGPSGEPVEGASIGIGAARQRYFAGGGNVLSREGGAFTIEDVAPGRYTLSAEREGFAPGKLEDLEVGKAPVDGLVITLGAGVTVRGRVLGLEPEELSQVTIRRQGEWRFSVHPDYDGRYQLENLPPGDHVILAEAKLSGRRTRRPITLEEGVREVELDLEFGDGHVVTGTLFHGEERLGGVNVNLYGIDISHSSPTVVSSHDGSFRFADVPEGRHRLNVRDFDSGLQHEEDVEIRGDEDLRIDIVTGALAGRVVHDDGSPASSASIRLEDVTENRRYGAFGETDARGSFRLVNVGEGSWRVRATKSGYGPAVEVIEMRGNEVIDNLELRLQPASGLTLDLATTDGTRPGYLRATFVGSGGQTAAEGSFQADDDGRTLIDVVPDGSWRMLLEVPGYALVDQPVNVPSPPQAVHLAPEGRLEITVPELIESPSPARLALVGPIGPYPWRGVSGRVEQDTSMRGWRREVGYLAAGSWTVTVTTEDGRSWSGQATVGAGGVAKLEL